MIVMPANWSKATVHYWAGRYPGLLGHLYSPGSQRGPYPWLPYALDNGRFVAWSSKAEWDAPAYLQLLEWAGSSRPRPSWALVPDVVADREGTLREWDRWAPIVAAHGFPLAFAVQDGMTASDVPSEAAVVFVGGSTAWKLKTAHEWCDRFERVHIGRVNTYGRLLWAQRVGAWSVDGTGWGRGDRYQLAGLQRWLEEVKGERVRPQMDLFEVEEMPEEVSA